MEVAKLKELVENYWPNWRVLDAVEKLNLVATVGATASGKTTVMEAAIRSSGAVRMKLILSDVSRLPREGEGDGKDYHFREKQEMVEGIKKGKYVQVAVMPDGGIYATRPESYPKTGVGTIAVMSHVIGVFRRLPFKNMRSAFIVPFSYSEWEKWVAKQAKQSNWDDAQLKSRMDEARQSYRFALSDEWMRFVLNDEPAKAGKRLLQVAAGEAPDMEAEARRLAESYLEKLSNEKPKK